MSRVRRTETEHLMACFLRECEKRDQGAALTNLSLRRSRRTCPNFEAAHHTP